MQTDLGGCGKPVEVEPFQTTLHVDATAKRFCIDDCAGAYHLTKVTAGELAYEYDVSVADTDHAASKYRPDGWMNSTAGPWPMRDKIEFDRTSGAYQRQYRYIAGDPGASTFAERYIGQCQVAPFTGITPPRPPL